MLYPPETHGNASVSKNRHRQEIKVREGKDKRREDGKVGHNHL